jgi:polyphosphate glucokinase
MGAAAGVLGIDIGGSGIKGNLVDPRTGQLLSDRHKILTPQPATPDAVAGVVADLVSHFEFDGPVGCTFPAIVRHGTVLSAANVDESWIDTQAEHLFSEAAGHPFTVINDADAAGIAEMEFGAAAGQDGVVIVLTLGTGIGSALFVGGSLVPNTEFGHLEYGGHAPVEDWAAARVRKDEGIGWGRWADRVAEFLRHLDRIFSPDLFVIGGGVSRKWEKWGPRIDIGVPVVPALLQNQAGIVGAAMAAARRPRDTG